MKLCICILVYTFLIQLTGFCVSASERQLFEEAYAATMAGDAAGALEHYRTLAESHSSAELFNNMGNAYQRLGERGQAVLHYARALAIRPDFEVAHTNLATALAGVSVPEVEDEWFVRLFLAISYGLWWWLGAAGFWAAAGVLMLHRVFRLPRAAVWGAPVAGLLLLGISIFAISSWQDAGKMGVVLNEDTPLRVAPTSSAPLQFNLPAGTLANKTREYNDYIRVEIFNGGIGWIARDQFETIWQL